MSAAAANADRARLFFALWPDERVRETLGAAARAVQAQSGGRAVAPDKIHLTLFFVGSIERARLPALESIGGAMRSGAFELILDKLGHFRRSGIVWCGAREAPVALTALAGDMRAALKREGVAGEERPFVPHVTLIRDAVRAPRSAAFSPCAWAVREFTLVESEPVGGTMRYAVRARWPL